MKTTEKQRLQELLDLQILDTPAEAEYDEITLLASEICGAPISLVSLIDEKRQWFKSRHNYQIQETPRESSFCQHVIGQTKAMVIPDATLDPRFKDNPAVLQGEVRFYAGAPLITKGGFGIGTLCVFDKEPKYLTPKQIQALETLSKNVIRLIEIRRHNLQIKTMAQQVAQRELMLVEAAKMASLGQMAGGIAHEINNPLTIISINMTKIQDLVRSGNIDPAQLKEYGDRVQVTTERIARIIRGMRDFSGDGAKDPMQVVNVKEMIEGTLSFCHDRKARQGISFKWIQTDPNLQLECKSVQISQVLLNLINNACDALEHANPKVMELEVREVGDKIQFQLLDSGCGIPPEIQGRVFQPFYTTKDIGRGIGLGLSIARDIVEAHNGEISLRSSPAGTTFKILLPKKQS